MKFVEDPTVPVLDTILLAPRFPMPKPFDVGSIRQLLFDDFFVAVVPAERWEQFVAGIEGYDEGGCFSTRPLAFEGDRLVVNVEPTGPNPKLSVQLLRADTNEPIPGHTFDDCRTITQDGLDAPVLWNSDGKIGAAVPRRGVRLHVRLCSMRLYAFQFVKS